MSPRPPTLGLIYLVTPTVLGDAGLRAPTTKYIIQQPPPAPRITALLFLATLTALTLTDNDTHPSSRPQARQV